MQMPFVITQPVVAESAGKDSPFSSETHAYESWKASKLLDYPQHIEDLLVELDDPACLSTKEINELLLRIRKTNFVLFRVRRPEKFSKATLITLGQQLGIIRLDGNLCSDEDKVSSIAVDSSGNKTNYIPYTNRPISWHTDGYYNHIPEQTIRSFILYCVEDAVTGGVNRVLDHELAYIYLRDASPDLAASLFHPEAMTIPPNTTGGEEIRNETRGPVFSVDAASGTLHMRYTARKRNIQWLRSPLILEAATKLGEILSSELPGIFTYRMSSGEGLIGNNILHMRTGFTDSEETPKRRLLYRARYFDRIQGTCLASQQRGVF